MGFTHDIKINDHSSISFHPFFCLRIDYIVRFPVSTSQAYENRYQRGLLLQVKKLEGKLLSISRNVSRFYGPSCTMYSSGCGKKVSRGDVFYNQVSLPRTQCSAVDSLSTSMCFNLFPITLELDHQYIQRHLSWPCQNQKMLRVLQK